jgi:hypothetical protein
MKRDRLQEIHRAAPFRPFRIHLTSGKDLAVMHPDYLFFPPESDVVVVVSPGGQLSLVEVAQIASVDIPVGPSNA